MKAKKILSLLVAMAMLFSCVGITAMAEETATEVEYVALIAGADVYVTNLNDAFTYEYNPNNNSVILLKDCAQDVDITSGGDYSFYLNGHTLTGSFKLSDGVVNFNGSLAGTTEEGAISVIQNTGLDNNYPLWCETGNFNLAGDVKVIATEDNGTAIYSDGSKMTITGAIDVTGNVETGTYGSISITKGTYNGTLIKGTDSALEVVGGTFSEDPSAFIPDGYEAVLEDGVYTVKAKEVSLDDLTSEEEGVYLISTPQDVVIFRTLLNTTEGKNILSGIVFKVTKDIDMDGITLAAAGNDSKRFMGTFDGQNHKISNVNIQAEGTTYVAFFGNISGATIKDITLDNITVLGGSYTAGLVGFTRNSTIDNCAITGNIDISGTSHVGGIHAGGVVSITDCEVSGTGTISGSIDVGAISGLISEGSTTVTGNNVSGITVEGDGLVGGLIGRAIVGSAGLEVSGNSLENVSVVSSATAYTQNGLVVGSTQAANGTATYEDNATTGSTLTVAGVESNIVYCTTNFDGTDYSEKVETDVLTPVAEVNGVEYTDIQEAIVAAAPSGTVNILNDIVVDEWIMFAESLNIGTGQIITQVIDGMTINGNDHTLTINSIESAKNGNCLFFDATKLNIKDLTIKYADGLNGAIGLKAGTIENVTFEGCIYGIMPQTGDVKIIDCTFKTKADSIYFEEERDGLVVTGCTFENADNVNVILLRGDVEFTNNTVISGRTVNVVSGSPVVTGNDFNNVRFKVYNEATANIENNEINVLAFDDESEVKSTFGENKLSEDAQAVLDAALAPAGLSYAQFNEIIRSAEGGVYDGNDITVILKDSERSYQNNKTAQFFIGGTNVNITDPVEAVKVSNVNFVFEDDDTANTYTSGELQVFAKYIEFTDCTFTGVAVSPWGVSNTENAESATFTDCEWINLSGRYGIHQNRASALAVKDCKFINCERGIHTNSSTVSSITITGNTFTGIGEGYGVLCLAEGNGDLSKANLDISGNTAEGQVMLRQLSNTLTYDQAAEILDEAKNTYGTAYVSNSIVPETPVVAKIGDTTYSTLAEAVEKAKSGDEIVLLADVTEDVTVPAGIIFNGNGKQVGIITAAGEITFKGYTKATNFGTQYTNTTINIGKGACLELTGTGRMVIGHGCTFNIEGNITDAKSANTADLTPSLIIPGASFTGAGVTFNVKDAYIKTTASYCSSSSSASGTFDFNIENSIWEQFGKLAFESQSTAATVNFDLKDSVLTTTSHLVFGVSRGEIVIDNSNVNVGTSRQIENQSTMTIKNGSVVNGAVATSSNAKNPGTIIVDNATYAVTGEFSGSDLGTGTLIIKKGATVAAGSITNANIVVDATDMAVGDTVNITANLSKLAGTVSVINNNLDAKIEDNKVVLIAKPVAKIGETTYATLKEAIEEVQEGETITLLAGTLEEGTIKLPATLKNVTIKGADEHATILKDMTIMAADGNSFSYIGLTFDGIVFDNSRLSLTGWRNGEEIIEDLTVTNCIFKNLYDETNSAPIHINKDASEPVSGFAFANNVIDGATGGQKSGIYLQATGNVVIENNVINNVSFRPYVIQLTSDDNIADSLVVTGNTFSGSKAGRAQALTNNAEGTDVINLVVNNNIFKDITDAQQICYWNFNPETTTTDFSKNYYDIVDLEAHPEKIYFNGEASSAEDLVEMGIYPRYTELNEDGTINLESEYTYVPALAKIGDTEYATVAAALEDAKAAGMTDVTITLIGETTKESATALDDSFDLYTEQVFDSITFKQEDSSVPYYIAGIYTGSRTNNGAFVFDGVNIVVLDQYILEGNVKLTNNSVIKSVAEANCFIYNGETTIEPGSKIYGVIEDFRGGKVVIDGGRNDGGFNETPDIQDSIMHIRWSGDSLTVKNGAFLKINAVNEIGRLNLAAGTSLNVSASKVETWEYIDNAGAINIDVNSMITTKKITGAGVILIDAADFDGNDAPVIDADMSGFAGTIEVINNSGAEYKIEDGKLIIVAKNVASVTDAEGNVVNYTDIQEAFKAATDNCTIEILDDVVIDYKWDCRDYATNGSHSQFKESVTINGNNHTIKFTDTISDSNWNTVFRFEENAIVKDLKIDISEATGAQRVITAKKSLDVDNLTIIGSVKYGIIFGEGATAADLANAEISIANSDLNGTRRAISDNEGGKDVKSVTITGNTLNANVAVSALETVTFTGNTMTDGYVDIRSYTEGNTLDVTATGNTLTANTEEKYNYIKAGGTVNAQDEFVVPIVGTLTCGYAENYNGFGRIWGEATGNPKKSVKLELYSGEKLIATTKLNDRAEGNITLITGGVNSYTWSFLMDQSQDAWWTTTWEAGQPNVLVQPDKVVLYIDDVEVAENVVKMTSSDNLHPITWKELVGVRAIELPTATVGEVPEEKLVNAPKLTFSKRFVATEPTDEQEKYYGDWYADFELKVNKDVTFNADSKTSDGYLAGSYDWYQNGAWISVPFEDVTLKAGQTVKIMSYAAELMGQSGLKLTYNDVLLLVKTFDCGVFFTEEFLTANPDLEVTLELRMYNPENEDESYVIGETYEFAASDIATPVAEVNGTGYKTLQAAVDAAEDGDTVTLLDNIDLKESIVVTKELTLDLAGKTITGTDNATGNFALIEVQPDTELTINDTGDTGKITLTAANERNTGSYSSVISNQRGKLTVNGGTIEHLGGTYMAYGIDNLTNTGAQNAETIINGGTIKSTYRAIRQFLNSTKAQNILTVNGGTIEGTNKSIWMQDANASANPGTLTVGADATLKGDAFLSVTAGSTEWPVEVSIAAAALDGESTVLTNANVPEGYEVKEVDGIFSVVEKADLFEFYGASPILGNSLAIDFAIDKSNFDGEGYYAEIEHDTASGVVKTTIPMERWNTNGNYYVINYSDITAKQIVETMYITIYDENGNQVSVRREDGVKAYAERQLAKETTSDKLKTTLVDLLNYGAAAQKQFGYRTDMLANADLTEEQKAYASDMPEIIDEREFYADKCAGSSLVLKDNIRMEVAFAGITEGMTATATYTKHNATEAKTYEFTYGDFKTNGGYKVLTVDTLVIADAKQLVTITVYNEDGSVYTTYKDSMNSYLARQIAKGELESGIYTMTAKFTASAYNVLH